MKKYKLSKLYLEDMTEIIKNLKKGASCHIGDCKTCIICRTIVANFGYVTRDAIKTLSYSDINNIIAKTKICIESDRFVIESKYINKDKKYSKKAMRHLELVNICRL